MNENLVNESQDISIDYDCGRFVASVKVGNFNSIKVRLTPPAPPI